MTELLPYTPLTDRGRGLILPITKASNHILLVYAALIHNWPMTLQEAAAEIDEALNHLGDLETYAYDAMSDQGQDAVKAWTDLTTDLHVFATQRNNETPDAPISDLTEHITSHAQHTWALLSHLDTELAALAGPQADPGRLP